MWYCRVRGSPAVLGFLEDAPLPELPRHRLQPHRLKELLSLLEHLLLVPALAQHGARHIEVGFGRVGFEDVANVGPLLCPHVAQEVGGEGAAGLHLARVLQGQLVPHVRVQLLVQGLQALRGEKAAGLGLARARGLGG